MQKQAAFFDFAAEVGLTKHIGGIQATEALVQLCQIGEGQLILDVGCGVGVTPVYLARQHHCRVVGVDICERMIDRSREKAHKVDIGDRVEFRVADAQDLPFEADHFDAVITESVTAFPEDKQRAVNEYARVTKPGGYVGLNESVWLKLPPPPEMLAWVSQDIGATVQPLSAEAWVVLLEQAGLLEIVSRIFHIDVREETGAIIQRYGKSEYLRVTLRMLSLYARSPEYREFVKRVRQVGVAPPNLYEYFGYGLFVGRKAP